MLNIRMCLLILLLGSSLSAQEPRLIARPDAFPPLVNPNCSHCRDEAKRRATELRPEDRVLCWIRGYSDGGAIPHRFFLNRYPVISDSYGVFVHDADAEFVRGYAPSYHFRFHGWRNGVLVMSHKDGTLYSALTGLAFAGPNKGSRLTPVPTLASDWGFWLDRYPNAVAYHMFDRYQPFELPATPNTDSQASRGPGDPRLPAQTKVLGVRHGATLRAYPITDLSRLQLIRDTLEGETVLVLWQPRTQTAAAFRSEAEAPRKYVAPRPNKDGESPPQGGPAPEKRAITLKWDGKNPESPYVDVETGSRWDVAGRATEGSLKGWTLVWLDSVQVKWFAWAAEEPGTTVYGR